MAANDKNSFDAYGRYEEIRKTKKPSESFFDHFTKETQEEFQKFIDVFWRTEYPALRGAYMQYFSFINYKNSNNKSMYSLSQVELERVIDFLVLFIFLSEEKNPLCAEFAKKEITNDPFGTAEKAVPYLLYSLTSTDPKQDKRYYLQELVATLRGNRGVCNHYSHKKFKLEKGDYLPVS